MPLVNDDGSPFNPLAPVGKPEGLIVTRDQWSPPIREGGPPQSDAMGQRGTPSFMDTLGASFRLENEVVGAVRAMGEERDFGDEDPDHNPWDTIKDTKYQDYWQAFTASRNPAETEHIRSKIDAELEDRRIREASGATGFLTDMVASLASPTVLLPGGAIYRGFRVGSAVARSAASVGALAAASVTAQELMLQSQQYTRTWTESMINIGGGTVLGGLLGGGVSFFSSRALARAARQIDDDIVRIRSDVDPQPTGAAQAAGAAPSRVVQENVPEGAFGLEKAFSWQGPLTRVLASEIRAARDVMTRLAEVPFRLRQNREGIATGPAGGSVEGRIKIDGDVAIYRASEALHKAFAEYRFGNADAKFAKSKAAFGDMVKPDQGRLGWKEFKQEITAALRAETSKGIEHPIPQVKAAAEAFRKEVFEPFKKEAQKLGLFPEDAEFSFNYVMRRYDINAILNNYERFRGILVEHLKGGQAKARAELAAIEREIAKANAGDVSGEVDTLRQQFEAERARVQEARNAQTNVKESVADDEEYLAAIDAVKPKNAAEREALAAERLDVETRIADEKAARAKIGERPEFAEREALASERLDVETRIELDPAVVQAVEGMAARLGIQMPDLKGLDLDAMMEAVTRAIVDMTGMSKGTDGADLKALRAKADELRFIADADDAELSQIAADTISKITGSPAARGINPYDAAFLQGPSGPLHARTLKIPDEKIVDFLDDDIERIALQYVRSMAPDVALTREFGDLNLTEDLKRIEEEAQKLMAANPERAAEIDAQSKRAQKDLQAVVGRLRGTYNLAHDPTSFGPRAASAVKQANVLRLMGSVLAASISDVPRLLFTHGFRQNADLFSTLITNLEGLKMAKAEAKELSAGLEFVLSRSGQLWDAFDDMVGHTVGERALRVMTNKFGRLTLMDQWNATWKQLSGIMTMNRVLRHSVDLMNGKLNPKDLGKLAASGIDEAVAERIAAQYQKHGTVYGRLFLANANDWDDPLARQALQAAVRREADITVVTPGQERPLWTSGTYGSVVAQFRTFQLISVQRTLIAGLQEMDAAKVSAMAMMISLGMLSEQLKMIIHGKEKKNQPKDMGDWMYVGLANSGILGWLSDADQMAHKVTRGNISVGKFAFGREAPTSRFASQNAIGALAGPSAGAFADVVQAIGAASSGEVRESDVNALRRLMPYQNLFYLSRPLRAFEDGMIDAFGIPRIQRRN
jgi:hypothetical protein